MSRFFLPQFAFPLLLFTLIGAASCKKIIVSPIDSAIKDSVVIRDSIVISYDTVRVKDTVTVIDTVIYNDSTTYRDTVIHNDTVKIIEIISKIDTITYADTIWTEKVTYDTVKVIDSIRVYDTIKVYDTIRVSIPPQNPDPTSPGNSILVGNGSGNLTINRSTLSDGKITTIRIRGGTYSTIALEDLNGSQENPLIIINEGIVHIKEVLTTNDINNVQISGAGSKDTDHGIIFENLSYRAIRLSGKMNGVTINNIYFKNVADYAISGERGNGSGLQYDGTANTRTERLKILNCVFDNTGSVVFGGTISNTGDTGFFKDVEIAYNNFKNSETTGVLCSFTNVEGYNIHHNTVNNVNQRNNNHNGIFHMQGSGNFYSNKLTNYQGNAIRVWGFSRGNTPVTIEIYNNICFNTRKYGGFEIQEFSNRIIAGKTTYVNAKVYNNTVGRMDTSHEWQGQILDLYNLSGTLSYQNNLGFELYSDDSYHPVSNMINNMGGTDIILDANNLYFSSQADAVTNTGSFASKHKDIGASLNL